jgi:3-deoxy-D-arabino-heptulosonate 7-phosphate (DAHP) synthase
MFVVMQAQATEEHVRAVCQKSEPRNTLDLGIVPAIRRESHLPILVDPSHGTGKRPDEPASA